MTADVINSPPPMIGEDFEDRLGQAYDDSQVLAMA